MLFELCQRDGKDADIRCDRNGKRNMASVYVDGELLASSYSEQKENATFHADKAAVNKLPRTTSEIKWINSMMISMWKMTLKKQNTSYMTVCGKKKWPNPEYIARPLPSKSLNMHYLQLDRVFGRDDEKKDVFFVKVETKEGEEGSVLITGSAKPKLRDAQSYAATRIIRKLHELNLT
ncbi:unnamed protein product [Fraxinus pennsylvanica]|uniref:DRBM domain-containing protein n=1 Tax=Fraxinus pennsylvanica TaxID=56036 RepID=A0AAD1YUC1_9LAMI|nr:unnamed protein product [Fraxinus pennsylvanica]